MGCEPRDGGTTPLRRRVVVGEARGLWAEKIALWAEGVGEALNPGLRFEPEHSTAAVGKGKGAESTQGPRYHLIIIPR